MLKSQNLFARRDPSLPQGKEAANPTQPAQQPAMTVSTVKPVTSPSAAVSTPQPEEAKNVQPKSEVSAGNRLIVGPDVKLKGAEILDCDTLVVEGRVEATMDSRIIRIAEQGKFCGKVGIDTAEIMGSFEGELTARDQLIIHATGRVSGKIRYGKILIEEGGQVSGDIQMLGAGDKTSVGSADIPVTRAFSVS